MSTLKNQPRHFICYQCSNPLLLSDELEKSIECDRCGYNNHRLARKSAKLTLAFSMTALIFYIPANFFPFMTVELYGNKNSSTIWSGILSLAEDGSWPIALIVFLASMLIPFLKLIILFYLSLTANSVGNPKFKTRLYHIIEAIGRWSMLDIYLLAVLVAVMKLGHWTSVTPEVGSVLFAFVVIFTMLASDNFDPKLLWDKENEKTS
ncbi:MAG: paraquat-inducible protein A [Oligoflexia bacterium]|nr:paraquat-inducible protein A [Oligoflexia bacterium]